MRYRPICWFCNREIHPLDTLHHLWCHGPLAKEGEV